MMYGYGMMGGMGGLGMLGMLLLWAGVIALVALGLLRLFPRTWPPEVQAAQRDVTQQAP